MQEPAPGRPYTLQQLVPQILLATFVEREGLMLRLERGGGDDAPDVDEARRRKLGFVAMLTEDERRDVRASFSFILADLPDTSAVPYSTDSVPALYPVGASVSLFVVGRPGGGGASLTA